MTEKPKPSSSLAQKELDKVEAQFDAFDKQVKDLTLDQMNMAPVLQTEPQTQIAQVDREKMKDIYLKPDRSIGCKEKFNEKFRTQYEYDKELVYFEAENKEVIGDTIEIWTRPYAGMPAEFWKVPANKPVYGPRYLAEQIKRKCYHRLVMQNTVTESYGHAQFFGSVAADTTIQRLDARPATKQKSIFMGSSNFLTHKAA
jgi:hypothetical protein